MLKQTIHIASKQLYYLTTFLVVMAVLIVLTALLLSQQVTERQDDIANWVSTQTGYTITIEKAGLYWFDLIPKLEISGVKMMPKQGDNPVFRAEQLFLALDVFGSIRSREITAAYTRIQQAKIAVKRDESGAFRVVGIDSGETANTKLKDVMSLLTRLPKSRLDNVYINYSDALQPELSGLYSVDYASLDFSADNWQLETQVNVPKSIGNTVFVKANADITDTHTFKTWEAHIQADELSVGPLLKTQAWRGAKLEDGLSSFNADIRYKDPESITASVDLHLNDLTLAASDSTKDMAPVIVDQLSGKFTFEQQSSGWSVQGQLNELMMAGESWPQTHFEVINNVADNSFYAESDYIRMSDVTSVALILNDMPTALISAKPAGDIQQLSLTYQPENGLKSISASVNELTFLPWQQFPGANNLSFTLDYKNNTAALDFNSQNISIYADNWLDDAIHFSLLKGQLNGRFDNNNWDISSQNIRLLNDDFDININGQLAKKGEQLESNLEVNLSDFIVKQWQHYVPIKLLEKDFQHWSADAFKGGIIRTGKITMHGDPLAFPFDEKPKAGSFDMQLNVENTHLHYGPGWPDLTEVTGTISGQGNNLVIKSQSGKTAGFNFDDVTTTISNLVRPDPILKVTGLVKGTTSDALNFLKNSPLQSRFGILPEWLSVTGKSDIRLDLTVPLVRLDDTQVKGSVSFINSQLTTKAVEGLVVDTINGRLAFDNKGVSVDKINAQAFNEPITITAQTENAETQVNIDGHLKLSAVNEVWPNAVPSFIKGDTDYNARIDIREPEPGDFELQLSVNSDLGGIEIDAPAPLGKEASSAKALSISIQDHKQHLAYNVRYDDWLDSLFTDDNNQLNGQVMLGGSSASLSSPGFSIAGQIEQINSQEWIDWQNKQPPSKDNFAEKITAINLLIDRLFLAQQIYNDLHVQATQQENSWKVLLSSAQMKGEILLPEMVSNEQPIKLDFDYLNTVVNFDSATIVEKAKSELWPAIDIDIDSLKLNNLLLGKLNLVGIQEQTDKWTIKQASLTSDYMTASLSGSWTHSEQSDLSRFKLNVNSNSLEDLLDSFNYQKVIAARQVKTEADLYWNAAPTDVSRENIQGDLSLSVGRGSLMDVEPGAAGRIFGLLSIAAIPRRLSLDFSDLFGGGFDFSSIKGHFKFKDGIATTDDFTMQGDSAIIEMKGPIDMVSETYNQVVKITPKVSSTLPIAGAMAGGPIGLGVGTAILIFDKIAGTVLDKQLVNLISYRYRLNGPWQEPKLTPLTQSTE